MLQRNGIDCASCLEEAGGENTGLTSVTRMPKKPDVSHSQTQLTLSLPLSFDGGGGSFLCPPIKNCQVGDISGQSQATPVLQPSSDEMSFNLFIKMLSPVNDQVLLVLPLNLFSFPQVGPALKEMVREEGLLVQHPSSCDSSLFSSTDTSPGSGPGHGCRWLKLIALFYLKKSSQMLPPPP